MIDIVTALNQKVREKIKATPCHANRASSLGYAVPEVGGCVRRGWYERTAWQEKELPDISLQRKFDEGSWHESRLMQELWAAGVHVVESQRAFDWAEYQITGHIDGKIINDEDGKAVPLEIKSMASQVFDQVKTFDDFRRYPWTRAYMVQIQLYMLLNNEDTAVFLLKNKNTGEIRQINVELDYELAEAALKTAESINNHIAQGTDPDRISNRDTCALCSFKSLCLPEINWVEPLKIEDDPSFAEKLDRYAELKDAEKEAGKLWDEIRGKAKATAESNGGALNMLVGNWHLSGEIKNNRFNLKTERV